MRGRCLGILLVCTLLSHASQTTAKNNYAEKAEFIFHKIYELYWVPQYDLFSEYYPSSFKAQLNYFQGAKVTSKEVSYLWPFSEMLSSVNVLARLSCTKNKFLPYIDSLAQETEKYLDETRKPIGYQAYPSQFGKVDRYYDDNGLIGINYVDAYSVTKNKIYLNRAEKTFNFIFSGWNNDLGGGVTWLEGHYDQKPACSNGMATVLALKLYVATQDTFYLDWGLKFYNWMYHNLRDSQGIYWNDRKTKSGEINKIGYTYNTGTMLQSAVILYKITSNPDYLREAQFLAKGSYQYFGRKGPESKVFILDSPWFAVVLFRGFEALYNIDGNSKYIDIMISNANYAWVHAKDKDGLFNNNWGRNVDKKTKPKWLLDEACMIELFARISTLNK
jgi:uncharacterized protein YyaL (SSP411 family)